MQFIKVPFSEAEQVKAELLAKNVLDVRVRVDRDTEYIYFPVRGAVAGYELIERVYAPHRSPQDMRAALEGVLTPEEEEALIGSYDVVGSIAIIEVPEVLLPKEDALAAAVLEAHPQVSTVLKKSGKHEGEFRTQSYTCIAGIDTRETIVRESGCSFLVDVERVYFSVRSSTERLRIASLVVPGETVLVLFSGAAPFVVIIAKKSLASKVIGVEKNKVGHEYGLDNVKRNKVKNAELYCADCADLSFLKESHKTFDRIIMPLPASSEEFIEAALAVVSHRAVLHVYKFGQEDEREKLSEDFIARCARAGYRAHVDRIVKAGHHAPFVYRWCFDITVLREK